MATLTLALDTRFAVWGLRLAAFLAPVFGGRFATRLAQTAVNRGIRYRVGSGRWRALNPHVALTWHEGHGQPMEGIEVPADGTEHTLTVEGDGPTLPPIEQIPEGKLPDETPKDEPVDVDHEEDDDEETEEPNPEAEGED